MYWWRGARIGCGWLNVWVCECTGGCMHGCIGWCMTGRARRCLGWCGNERLGVAQVHEVMQE